MTKIVSPRKRKAVAMTLAGVGILAAGAVIGFVSTANASSPGVSATSTSQEASPSALSSPQPVPIHMSFPVNARGQSYGSDEDVTSPADEPDLILAWGSNGQLGYVFNTAIHPALPTSPEQALAAQAAQPAGGIDIPLYASDGVTVIGKFHLDTAPIAGPSTAATNSGG